MQNSFLSATHLTSWRLEAQNILIILTVPLLEHDALLENKGYG